MQIAKNKVKIFLAFKNESPSIVVVNKNIGGKLMANNNHLTCHMLCVPSLTYLDANQNTTLDGKPNNKAAMNGLFFQNSQIN